MMSSNFRRPSKAKSLTAQIRDAERQVLCRQREVRYRYTTLVRKVHQEMTAPASLLLAAGIGFIIGELTKHQTTGFLGTKVQSVAAGTTPLRTVLNLFSIARTLYMA